MNHLLRWLFFAIVVRPILLIVLGVNARRREQLPTAGPGVVVANHNSHLDALVLMTLFPLRLLPRVRPVAAADYFLKNRLLAWFALKIIGILPLDRQVKDKHRDPLAGLAEGVERGDILLIFPEGSRGEPEQLADFKSGVAHLAKRFPELPFYPVYLHGLGKALPKGEALLVPFFCDIFVGSPLTWTGDKAGFMHELTARMTALAEEGHFPAWQ